MKPGIVTQVESKPKDIVVYKLASNKESVCSQCQKELNKGNLLTLEDGKGLCMVCADLDHLVTLPSGDAALTRRTKKYSRLWAVIIRFSRARKRYERQGWLVEEGALTKAEEEVLSEGELKEQRRMNEAFRREDEDEKLAREIQTKLLEIFPQCPAKDAERIARQGSEYIYKLVKRTESGDPNEDDIRLTVTRHARHRYTPYDDLLMKGMKRPDARQVVQDELAQILGQWSGK